MCHSKRRCGNARRFFSCSVEGWACVFAMPAGSLAGQLRRFSRGTIDLQSLLHQPQEIKN
ncbi:hypothetical protein BSU04_22290 [Caballeronia sordidicola]|uniref:Uncharacterized protein n=1 Tax=Caballeronia sordidicola TaxID=196367 RepID=A0A226WZU0_CABSO|nr:hypothetical protein BSU04_22290 [Caballeronia sordidicola]